VKDEIMTKLPIERRAIEASYELAKDVYEVKTNKKLALDTLVAKYGMNRNSASDYLYLFGQMMKGARLERTANAYATEYFLKRIYEDEGKQGLKKALTALRQHIDYYEQLDNTKARTNRSIYEKFVKIAEGSDENGNRQILPTYLLTWSPKRSHSWSDDLRAEGRIFNGGVKLRF